MDNQLLPLFKRKFGAAALAVAFGLTGCASFPLLEQPRSLKLASDYQAANSFAAPDGLWPAERWWEGYGDPQITVLIDEALRDSPDLAAASARVRQAEAFGKVAGAALLPQVGANASVTYQTLSYNYLTPRNMTPSGWNDYGIGTVNLVWDLDFWGKNRAGLAAATSQLEASLAELAQARLCLSAAVAAGYADLARLFALRDVAGRSVEVRKKTAELFDNRFNNGLETRGSLSEARARLAASEGELLMIDEQIGLQRNRIAALLGAGPDRGISITRPGINLKTNFVYPAKLAANLIGRRPDITAARLVAEAQAHRIKQKKAEFYPDVNLAAFIGFQSLNLDMLTRSSSSIGSVGPAISLPIFTAGRLQGELRGAAAAYDEAVAVYNRTVTQALQEVANAGLSAKALTPELAKGEAAAAAAGEAHQVASNRYQGGLASYLEVLYAEDILLDTQRQLANLRSRALTLDVALKRALGGGYQNDKI